MQDNIKKLLNIPYNEFWYKHRDQWIDAYREWEPTAWIPEDMEDFNNFHWTYFFGELDINKIPKEFKGCLYKDWFIEDDTGNYFIVNDYEYTPQGDAVYICIPYNPPLTPKHLDTPSVQVKALQYDRWCNTPIEDMNTHSSIREQFPNGTIHHIDYDIVDLLWKRFRKQRFFIEEGFLR